MSAKIPIKTICGWCEKEIIKSPSRVRMINFCSRSCQMNYLHKLAKERTGKAHQNYVERIEIVCNECGKHFERKINFINENNFCSITCRDNWFKKYLGRRSGINNPNFLGGHRQYRGPNWHTHQRKALARDKNICKRCGKSANIVHHIIPFRTFEDYRQANSLYNLMTVCKSCHRILEHEYWMSHAKTDTPPLPGLYCKKCGYELDNLMVYKGSGIPRYCGKCREVKICQQCGIEYDITARGYSGERKNKSRCCSRTCEDLYKVGKHHRQVDLTIA
jgi:hypothetical protein